MPDERIPQGWRVADLGSLGTFFRGHGGTRVDEEANGLPCIRYGDLYTHHGCIVRSFCSAISPGSESAYTPLQSGDIVFAGSGETYEEIGKATAYCNHGQAYAGADTIIFRPRAVLNSRFAGYAVNSEHAISYKSKMGQGSSVIHISAGHLSHYPLRVPPARQQTRIADILSTIDEAIEQTKAVIAKTQQIKVGMMHDLFTRGVTKDGQLRPPRQEAPQLYKESPLGWIPREWGIAVIGQCGTVKLGRQRSPDQHSGKWTMPYLRVANVFDGRIDYGDILEMDFTPEERKTHSLMPGDILLNEGQSLELVGRSALYDGEEGAYCFQNTLVRFRPHRCNYPQFFRWLFKLYLDIGRFMTIAKQTTSVAHLGAERFARMQCSALSPDEQRLIGDRLQALHDKINCESELVSKLRQLKVGLMNDLLSGRV